jgi:NOL1/NOP2/fmu family ribosome biogenesis protein
MGNTGRISAKAAAVVKGWMGFPSENIIRMGNELILPACGYNDFLTFSGFLRIMKPGTRICTIKGDDFLPSHGTAMSVFFNKESFPTVDISLDQALLYLSRGQFAPENIQKGWNIVQYNGVNLGFIKNIGSRINNYYPVGWRIRMSIPKSGIESICWK